MAIPEIVTNQIFMQERQTSLPLVLMERLLVRMPGCINRVRRLLCARGCHLRDKEPESRRKQNGLEMSECKCKQLLEDELKH